MVLCSEGRKGSEKEEEWHGKLEVMREEGGDFDTCEEGKKIIRSRGA